MITVDAPTLGDRHRQQRAGFKVPAELVTPYYFDRNIGLPRRGSREGGSPAWRESLSWADIEEIRSWTRLPLILKGILDPSDAEQAVQIGANGLVVSNHGSRIVDTLPATIEALPQIVEQVNGRATVILDGGVRRGTDVLKALALGASAVMIGRPYVFALASGGASGVARCVNMLRDELETTMAAIGRRSIAEIDRLAVW
jgi:4-hydroxymandelate oxidase